MVGSKLTCNLLVRTRDRRLQLWQMQVSAAQAAWRIDERCWWQTGIGRGQARCGWKRCRFWSCEVRSWSLAEVLYSIYKYIYITIYIEIIRLVYNYNSSWLMPTHFGLPSPVLVGSAGLSQAIDLQSLAHKTAHEQPPKHAMTTLVKRGGWFLEMGQNPQKR